MSLDILLRRRVVLRRAIALGSLTAAIACGGDSTGPKASVKPGIEFQAGEGMTDTISASFAQALRVAVRDSDGNPMSGVVVRFSSAVGGDSPATVLVGDLSSANPTTFVAETTSTAGVASVRIVFGDVAGRGAVAVTVPEAGLLDTAYYTIRPGNATAVVLTPADTAIRIETNLTPRTIVRDRAGNGRTDPVSYRTTDVELTVSATGTAMAERPTRAAIIASVSDPKVAADTTWVSVVPRGTIATMRFNRLATMQLDGSAFTEIPLPSPTVESGLEWLTSNTLLAALNTGTGSLYSISLTGTMTSVLPSPVTQGTFQIPGIVRAFTTGPDGRRIYLTGNNCNSNGILYRHDIGTTGPLERLSPVKPQDQVIDDCFYTLHLHPTVSPDGLSLIFQHDSTSGSTLRRLDLVTKAITLLNVAGQRPRFSPSGNHVAFVHDSRLWLMRPNGSEVRPVTVPQSERLFHPGVTWSADGVWLMARAQPQQFSAFSMLVLVNVISGLELPLTFTSTYPPWGLPVWRPGS